MHRASPAAAWALAAMLPGTLLGASCAGRIVRTVSADPARTEIAHLWVAPDDLESRDLFHGPGGPALAPPAGVSYAVIAEDDTGFSPGYDVRDPDGTRWSVKLGIEAQPEVAASRVLWAIGFHQPPTYILRDWQLAGAGDGAPALARFRRESDDETVLGDWSWYENPFVDTRPFKGLLVANLMLNNWDWKTSNNKVYEIAGEDGTRRPIYVVRDLGASLGKTTFPALLTWTPFRAMAQGTRNDVDGFEEQGFIKRVDGDRVAFHYRGIHGTLVDTLTVDDVVWTCQLMSRLSSTQWDDAFRAAGYDEAERQRYVAKILSKIREGLHLL
jgi:hypothetical protein